MVYEGYEGDQLVQTYDLCKGHEHKVTLDATHSHMQALADQFYNTTGEQLKLYQIARLAKESREQRQAVLDAGKEIDKKDGKLHDLLQEAEKLTRSKEFREMYALTEPQECPMMKSKIQFKMCIFVPFVAYAIFLFMTVVRKLCPMILE